MDKSDKEFMSTSAVGETAGLAVEPDARVGIWRIEDKLGDGGMGGVFRAVRADGHYEQVVALKLMAPGSAARVEQFDRERQWLARLEHPNIARIVDGGTDREGRPFLAMELVEGTDIATHCDRRNLTTHARLALLRQLCAALSHAHGRLVLHRDIKPANVLIDGEGRVRLVDFGIASAIGEQGDQGRALTLAYAAPEQLRGDEPTAETDVFGAGCLLYRLLAGVHPPRTSDGSPALDAVRIGDPDLRAIVVRATHEDAERRYPSIDAFDDDLRAWLGHLPVAAREGGTRYRLGRFVARNPLPVALGSAAVLALASGLVASLSFARQARAERDTAQDALARAEWSIERGDFFNQAQGAYADVLQRLFGAQGNIEEQTAALRARVEEAQQRKGAEPDNAAFLSYTIGRHFVFRNDYTTALQILEPWVLEGYGPSGFQLYGEQLLAVVYMNLGRPSDAVPLLRKVERTFARGFDANTPDHAAAASQLAFTTGDAKDLRRADTVLNAALTTTTEPSIIIFFWNQLATIRRMLGDLNGAHDAISRAVAMVEENRLSEIAGKDTARLNLAEYEFYLREDAAKTAKLIDTVIGTDTAAKGENRELGRALVYRGLLEAGRGEVAAAEATLARAVELTDRFAGAQSASSIHARIALAETLAANGKRATAESTLAAAAAIDDPKLAEANAQELALARYYVAARTRGRDAARALAAQASIPAKALTTSPRTKYRYERLMEMGVLDAPGGA